ncbi:MAG: glycosyltransferase family 4 protein [Patescibacteria group bacterium]|jgi:glycosyltransferase involved in cell wall biosynthesis|nr:glycosyltransferase family 4 protein [Patescibacteria group bacterium]
MKVLIVSLAYLPFIGGAELAVKEITDRLPEIDFDMITVNLDGQQPKNQQVGNVNIHRLGRGKISKYLFPWTGFKLATKLHQEKKYDAVWAIMANQAGLVALRLKNKFPQIKYLLTLQEGDSLKRIWSRTFLIRPLYRRIYRRADYIQSISSYLSNRAVQYGYRGKSSIVPNGVDLEKFKTDIDSAQLDELRTKLNLTSADKIVVTASRLVHKNGIDILIKSARNLPLKILILGQGELQLKLEALAQELGVKNKILFLGHIGQPDLPKYLKIADVFVRPSRSEGLGSAFLEAMAAGLPVIGTKVGGIPDIITEGQTGLFCEVDNPKDLENKIKLLLTDNDLRLRLIDNGKKLAVNKYDWQLVTSQMRDIFNSL